MTAAAPRTWGVAPPVLVACAVVVVGGAVWAAMANNPEDRVVAAALALFGLLAGAACVAMRRRLTADADGVVLRGPGGTRTISWSTIVDIAVVQRSRLGIASTTLELDLDDGAGYEGLIVLGRFDLGADPADVARELKDIRRPAGS